MPMIGCCRVNGINTFVFQYFSQVFLGTGRIVLSCFHDTFHGFWNGPFVHITNTGYFRIFLFREGTAHAASTTIYTYCGNLYTLVCTYDVTVAFGTKGHCRMRLEYAAANG